jgi:hypothetical protein
MYEFIFEVFPKPSQQDYTDYGTMDGAVAHVFVQSADERGDAEVIARGLIETKGWDIERDTTPVARVHTSRPAGALGGTYYDKALANGAAACFTIYPSGTFEDGEWRRRLEALPWDDA